MENGKDLQHVPGTLNGKPAMIDIGRIGVALLDEGTKPIITVLPDEYDMVGRTRTMFDSGDLTIRDSSSDGRRSQPMPGAYS